MNRQRNRLRGKKNYAGGGKGNVFGNPIVKLLFSAVSGIIAKDISSPDSKIKLMFNKVFQIKQPQEKRKIIKAKFEEIETGGNKDEK